MFFGRVVHFLKRGLDNGVVAVQAVNVIALRNGNAFVSWFVETPAMFFRLNKLEPLAKFFCVAFNNRNVIIVEAVANDNDLKILKRLFKETVQALADMLFSAINRNNYGDRNG